MKKLIILSLIVFAFISCKKQEVNPDDYPTTVEESMEYNLSSDINIVRGVTFTKTNEGKLNFNYNYITFDGVDLTSETFDTIKTFLVENSIWEEGNDVLELTKNKKEVNLYSIDKSEINFNDLENGNFHLEVRNLDGDLLANGNCGINSILDTLEYLQIDDNSVISEVLFRGIGNGVVSGVCFKGGEDSIYYANQTIIQLIAGNKDNPRELIYDNLLFNFYNYRSHDRYQLLFTDYKIEDVRNIDAHINFIYKSDSSVITKVNIGINAE